MTHVVIVTAVIVMVMMTGATVDMVRIAELVSICELVFVTGGGGGGGGSSGRYY